MNPDQNGGVQFYEEQVPQRTLIQEVGRPHGMIGWLVSKNIASSEAQARNILIGLIVFIWIIIFYLLFFSGSSHTEPYPPVVPV